MDLEFRNRFTMHATHSLVILKDCMIFLFASLLRSGQSELPTFSKERLHLAEASPPVHGEATPTAERAGVLHRAS